MAKIFTKGTDIYVAGTLSEPIIELWYSEGLIEKAYRKNGLFVGPIYNLPRMLELAPNITDEKIHALAEQEIRRQVETEEIIRYGISDEEEKNPEYNGLWKHQIMGVKLARINKRFGFWFDTRTGKTRMMIQAMYEALKSGKCQKCLVICPTAIIPSWLADIQAFKPELKAVAYYGSDKQKRIALTSPCHIFIMSMELTVRNIQMLRQIKFNYVVIDESSKLKNHRSQISQTMLEYANEVEYLYELSATPAPNCEAEYYVQMRCIDQFIFPPARKRFVEKYFINKSRNAAYEKLFIRHEVKNDFMNLLKTKSVFIDQTVMPTAGKEWKMHTYKLDSELMKMYESFKESSVIELENTEISTDMVAAINAKLSQITSGFIIDTDAVNENKLLKKIGEPANRQEIFRIKSETTRIDELKKLLSNFPGESVVIWATYKQEFADIKEALGTNCRCVNGSTTTRDKEQFISDFKAKKFQYLIAHPASIGMGINLTVAHIAIYYSLTYSWEALKQSSERICGHITVQPHKAEYYVMAAEGTIDAGIYDNVKNKKTTSESFLQLLRGY